MNKDIKTKIKDKIQKRLDIHSCTGRCTDYIMDLFKEESQAYLTELIGPMEKETYDMSIFAPTAGINFPAVERNKYKAELLRKISGK